MKQTDPSPNKISGADWRALGEFELLTGGEADGLVRTWMTETLSPLNLDADFLNKILRSARDAVTRAMRSDSAAPGFEHLHLLVFAPRENASKGKTWGFFRVEKVGTSTEEGGDPFEHAIEFYLYLE